jgi:putative DNA primase/helicase
MSKKKEILKTRRNSKDSEKQKLERLQNAIAEVNSWKDKKPEVSFINFMYLMNYAEIQIKYNQMTHKLEYLGDVFKNHEIEGLKEEQRLAVIREVCREKKFPLSPVYDYLLMGASKYHPAREWVDEYRWDGEDRDEALLESLNVKTDKELAREYLRVWSIQTARCLVGDKGFTAELVLILKGDQDAGKTRWIKSLAPEEFIKTGLQIDPKNKDSVLEANSTWINELGEFDGMTRKVDHALLKAYLSKSYDDIRRPYAHTEDRIPRKTSFCASVNNDSFLVDDTGNRRYLVIETGDIIDSDHGIDMQQYWAYYIHLARTVATKHWLEDDIKKLQRKQAEKFRQLDPICESFLMKQDELWKEEYFTKELITETTGIENPNQHQCKVLKQFLIRELSWKQRPIGQGRYLWQNPNYKLNKGEPDAKPF